MGEQLPAPQTRALPLAVVDRELRLIELDDSFSPLHTASERLLGQPIGAWLPALDTPLRAVLASGQPVGPIMLHVGSDAPLPLHLSPICAPRGAVLGIALTRSAASDADPPAVPRLLASPTVRTVLDGLFAFAGVLRPDGTLIEANRAALAAADLTAADVLGSHFADTSWWAYDPSVQAQLRAAIARVAQGETVRYDVSVRLANHRFITIDFMLAPARGASGQVEYLIPSGIDISARTEAEAALRASEARFRATFDHAPLGIAHVGRDGRWLRVNERFCAITGYTREELLARTFHEITHPDDLAPDQAQVERLLAGEGDHYSLEKRYLRRDGSVVWVALTVSLVRDQLGRPDYFIAIIDDISQRRADEAQLRFQAQLLDAVGQGVIATDTDGTVRFWNRFAEQLYGWPRAEAVGRSILDLVAPDISREQGEAIMAQLQAGEPWAGQYQVRRRDGTSFPAFVTDTPLVDAAGAVIGMVGISGDISEPLRLQAEREELLRREQVARAAADEARALLDTLLTTAPIGLCFLGLDYRFRRINEALAALNGVSVADHLGRTVREVLPGLAPSVEPLFDAVLATGQPLVDQEIIEEASPVTGGRRIWQASYYPVRLPDGAVAGLGIVADDVTARRTAAEQLRLSEERFRVALQNSHILVYTTDRALRYTWIYNPHPAFDAAAVLGHRDEELMLPEEAAKLTAVKQRVLDREAGERVELTLLVTGEPQTYDLTVEPLRDGAGQVVGVTVAAVDITARRAAEAALRESEARYSALAEAVPAILFTNRPDGANDYISQNYHDYTGTPRGSGAGDAWLDQVHPDDQERAMAAWQAAVHTGQPYLVEYRFRRHDGVYRWFRVHSRPMRDGAGAITRWFGVCLDIDDAKQAAAEREQLLAREREARLAAERTAARLRQLQAVTAALSEALTPAQVASVIVERSVSAMGAASGSLRLISADGQTLDALQSVGLLTEAMARWERIPLDMPMPICEVARTGHALYFENSDALAARYPMMTPIVAPLHFQAFAIVPLNIEGRTIGSLALTFTEPRQFIDEDRDTQLAMANQAAQAITRAQLYETARAAVEVRDTFIAVAAHDLRSPLTVLSGQAQRLERQAGVAGHEAEVRERARRIVDQTHRLSRMIGALFDLARMQSGQLTVDRAPLDLAALAARVADDIRPTLSQHTLELSGMAEGLWVVGDEVRLEQVLYNLIGNAVKYSPAGGPVRVHIEPRDDQACLSITDSGIGIPAAALPRLFERYFRVADTGASGMGIGLYAVREILDLHGGTIAVSSQEGVGSTFTVCLPLLVPAP